MALIDRYVGTCPVCEGIFKVHGEAMVLHGYQRPGDGYVHGECPGVTYPAYERSTRGCEMWRGRMQSLADEIERKLNRTIESDAPISREESRAIPGKPWLAHEKVKVTYRPGDEGYPHAKRMLVHQIESELRSAVDDVKRMQRLIRDWELRRLPTIKEDEERVQRDVQGKRDANLAEREAKESAKRERADQARRNFIAARDQAITDHARNFQKLEAVLPLLTDDVLAFAATHPHPYGGLAPRGDTRLNYVTRLVELASQSPDKALSLSNEYLSMSDVKRWAKSPLEAAKEISALARGELLPVKW